MEGWKWSHCISMEQAWLADRASDCSPVVLKAVRRRWGSTILGALHKTVVWGQSAKPSSHPSIIKSVSVNMFWHECLSLLITTVDPTTGIKEEKYSCLFDKESTLSTPVWTCVHVFKSNFKGSQQSIVLYGEDSFSPELWSLCQIRLRAACSLLTGAACSNDPWWESHLLWW